MCIIFRHPILGCNYCLNDFSLKCSGLFIIKVIYFHYHHVFAPYFAALDLLEKMLKFSPKHRISAEEGLLHPYLKEYSYPSDEPTSMAPLNIEHEVDDFCEDILKDMMYTECVSDTMESPIRLDSEHNFTIENDVLSLKDIMNSDEEPIADRSNSDSACNINISSFKFHPELKDSNSVSTKEFNSIDEITDSETTDKDPDNNDPKNCKSQRQAGISQVMETILGKEYKVNLGFSCKMNNALTGPFGLCYL